MMITSGICFTTTKFTYSRYTLASGLEMVTTFDSTQNLHVKISLSQLASIQGSEPRLALTQEQHQQRLMKVKNDKKELTEELNLLQPGSVSGSEALPSQVERLPGYTQTAKCYCGSEVRERNISEHRLNVHADEEFIK